MTASLLSFHRDPRVPRLLVVAECVTEIRDRALEISARRLREAEQARARSLDVLDLIVQRERAVRGGSVSHGC